jgi:hypothetical protein
MPQTPSRSVETPQTPRGFSSAAGAQQGGNGSGSEMKGFDSLLEGFSKEQSRENADSVSDVDLLGLSMDEAKDAPVVDITALQALLPITAADSASAGAAAFQPGSQAYSVLENLLPRILPQAGASGQPASELRDGTLASPMLAMPSLDGADEGILSQTYGSRLAVSVQNQETHFRPVIEGFESALQEPTPDGSIDLQEAAFEDGVAVADQEGGAVGTHIEGDAGVIEDDSHAPDILTIQAGVQGLLRRAAEIVGSDTDGQEDSKADGGQGRQATRAQQQQTTPESFGVLTTRHWESRYW